MQVDFDSIQPETIEHFKGGEGSVTTCLLYTSDAADD